MGTTNSMDLEIHLPSQTNPALSPDEEAIELASIDEISEAIQNAPKVSAFQISTGEGKTHKVADMVASNDIHCLISTPTHALADEVEDMAEMDADRCVGRRQATPKEIKAIKDQMDSGVSADLLDIPDGVCMAMTHMLQIAWQGHYPAQTICSTCPFGLATMCEEMFRTGRDSEWEEKTGEMEKRGLDPATTLRCGYILCQIRIQKARVITQAGNGTSEAQLRFKSPNGEYINRWLFVDERRQWMIRREIEVSVINAWIDRLVTLRALAKEQVDGITSPDSIVGKEIQARYNMLDELCDRQVPLFDLIREEISADEPNTEKIWGWIENIGAIDTEVVGRAKNTIICEKVSINWDRLVPKELDVPRRAIRDLLISIESGDACMTTKRTKDTLSHAIEYYVASPLLDVILRGIPEKTIFLDATLSSEVKAITRALGGSIYRKITASNVTVKANYSASVGRGGDADTQARRTKASVGLIEREIQKMAEELGCEADEIAVITHKPWAKACREAGVKALEIGWWGNHERGHNRWKNARGLIIVGAPYLSPAVMQMTYHGARAAALRAKANTEEWPWWMDDEVMEIKAHLQIGDTEVTWPGALPTNPILRRWVLEYYADEFVQAIGRLRSTRSSQLQAVMILGPVPDLSEHGITITPIQGEQLHILPSPVERGAGQRAQADLRVVEAMIALPAHERATYEDVRAWLIEHTGRGCGNRAIKRVRDYLASTGVSLRGYRAQSVAQIAVAKIEGAIRHQREDMPQGTIHSINQHVHKYHRQDEARLQQRRALAHQAAAHAPPAIAS